jgi:hypothetical protein
MHDEIQDLCIDGGGVEVVTGGLEPVTLSL